ncbi:hypothetical protein PTTG_00742 [Puccinia triticina 1-1 BBBD Race 1]|uniref:Uncharacterized protein n=1 Tax=Puccinia triticina (isolate 1-1 / race 1 (BBBD)) TaxID=630390 RepID=A0A0C4EJ25_PUCT1|nr:hypothetical protein PTTG_00742 [Puccinia triticina 1-1 BBBD Race 1]
MNLKQSISESWHPLPAPRRKPKGAEALDLPREDQPNLLTMEGEKETEPTAQQKMIEFGQSYGPAGRFCRKILDRVITHIFNPIGRFFKRLFRPFDRDGLNRNDYKILKDASSKGLVPPDVLPTQAEKAPDSANLRQDPDNLKDHQGSDNPNHEQAPSSPKPAEPTTTRGAYGSADSHNAQGNSQAQHPKGNPLFDQEHRPTS